MKNPPEVCAKCGGKPVLLGDLRDVNWVATYADPSALLMKGTKMTAVESATCTQCGYIELYAKAPGEIAQP